MFSLLYRAFIFTIDNCICICVCVFASCSPPVSECGGTRQSGARRRWLLKLDAKPARPKARKIPTTYLHSFMKTGILYMLQIHKETHAVYLHLGKGSPYLIFVIFFTRLKLFENKIYTENANFSR